MQLTAVEKRRAGTAIEYTFRDYTREGGLRELQEKTTEADQSCAGHIYSLALFATKQSKNLDAAATRFGEMCDYAEAGYKKKHEVENLKDVLPVWSVYKSNILRGMKLGLDPADFDSEGAYRLAVGESLRAAVHAVATPVERTTPARQDSRLTAEDADDLLDSTNIQEGLRAQVAKLVIEAEYVKRGKEKEAEAIVATAVEALSTLIDRRRMDKPTRTAISASVH